MRRRRWFVAGIAALSLGLAAPVAQVGAAPSSDSPASAVIAKTCGAGYTTAYINGSKKCLRRGQFCSRGAQKQYRRYGFYCAPNGRLK